MRSLPFSPRRPRPAGSARLIAHYARWRGIPSTLMTGAADPTRLVDRFRAPGWPWIAAANGRDHHPPAATKPLCRHRLPVDSRPGGDGRRPTVAAAP